MTTQFRNDGRTTKSTRQAKFRYRGSIRPRASLVFAMAGLLLFSTADMWAQTARMLEGRARSDPGGKDYYGADCARCHGINGKGDVPGMSAVPGYVSVDLTQLTKEHNGVFPRQEVYDAIDGRKRFQAHFIGDMPIWGLKYDEGKRGPDREKEVKLKISALVDYIESLQER